uniref:ERI1 exoribonuclease 3-like n=1 Tax=Hirondellea gigas TaxID=1518452 RepID=A0A2P2I771_9CRUS
MLVTFRIPVQLIKSQCIQSLRCCTSSSTANATLNYVRKSYRKPRETSELLQRKNCKPSLKRPQKYKYFLIVDFEATCEEGFDNTDPVTQEIIEFPALKLNTETLKVEAIFREFVRPRLSPILSPFCSCLTGISQDTIDESSSFPEVLSRFNAWYADEIGSEKCLTITHGNWDLQCMLPIQCKRENMPVPDCFQQWNDLKLSYRNLGYNYTKRLYDIVGGLDLRFVGSAHNGIDDCRNISNAVCEILNRGLVIELSSKLKPDTF